MIKRVHTQLQIGIVATCAMMLAVTLWKPIYPDEQWLQHIPTVVAIPALLIAARRGWFSDLSLACLTAMLALHLLGARWIYSYVPYDAWSRAILGSGPNEWFGWSRNHYDRAVHFAFGLLITAPLCESARRWGRLNTTAAVALAWIAIAAVSAAYEVFEWGLAVSCAPDAAERYNGQQGDLWDAQKDMALAMAGSSLAALAILLTAGNQRRAST